MDYKIVWSPSAHDDVEKIAAYIGKDSPFYAGVVVEQIMEASRTLKDFPKRGRIVPETNIETIREVFVYSYRVIYEISDCDITILAIVHDKRILPAKELL